MPTTIKLHRLHGTDAASSILDMVEGSMSYNTQTGKLYVRTPSLEVVEMAGIYDGADLPNTDPLRKGAFWNDNGTLKVSLYNA
jgi:hypothetical protein